MTRFNLTLRIALPYLGFPLDGGLAGAQSRAKKTSQTRGRWQIRRSHR